MNSTGILTEAQAELPRLLRQMRKHGTATISRRGKPAAFLISPDRMEAILETMEVLAQPAAMEQIRLDRAGKLKFRPFVFDEDKG